MAVGGILGKEYGVTVQVARRQDKNGTHKHSCRRDSHADAIEAVAVVTQETLPVMTDCHLRHRLWCEAPNRWPVDEGCGVF
jgi:hypothetical protein